jgi:hypothetical protein
MEDHMVNPLMAGAMMIFSLGGVPVSVTGPSAVLPKQPDSAHMEVVYSTHEIDAGTSVLMSDDSRWSVKQKRPLSSGAVQVVLRPPTSPVLTTLTIPADSLTVPIWWVGDVQPDPPPGEDPTEETPDNPDGPITPPVEGP